jgi:2'-5' RNA ligase
MVVSSKRPDSGERPNSLLLMIVWRAMNKKTHQTALVVIPPPACWLPIQAIRQQHDRQFRRWMPHINLLYPFRPVEQFPDLAAELRRVCREIEPLEITLAAFRHFEHRRGRFTLWLAPEPAEPLACLHAALLAVTPDCDDTARHGFTPHLSVGQVHGSDRLRGLQEELQASWQSLSFMVSEISLIWRRPPPEDVFRLERTIALGA